VGALPVATTNNLNFGNPERPEIMAQLVASIEGLAEACEFFEVPVTGGNVSLYNETLGTPIFPSPVIGIVGLLDGINPPVSLSFRSAGQTLVLLGGPGECDEVRFGGTQYAKNVLDDLWGLPPVLDAHREKRVQAAMRKIAAQGLADSAHDLSDGGLAVALAESSFERGIGASVTLDIDMRPEFLLFGEAPSRILVSSGDPSRIQTIAAEFGVPATVVGATVEGVLEVRNRNLPLISASVSDLRKTWSAALETRLESRR
jgi:phosphoribosylformylglycinamidine synthase